MQLKQYQAGALKELDVFLAEVRTDGSKRAFNNVTPEDRAKYKDSAFASVPFVCIKIPTGGGKTLVAAHAVDRIINKLLLDKMGRGIVLWFTPSDAIQTQTLRKLKDRKDEHRKVLDEAFDNKVRVFSNEEALNLRRADLADNLCIIVASLDAFRKDKTAQKKYKVYQENGALMDHFEHIESAKGLDMSEGLPINSLANVIRLDRPLIVIDEGHKVTTELSVDTLKELNPSFVIEYTATPRDNSNILVDISAAELKEEQMVKIPIVLATASQWQTTVNEGLEKRHELEVAAKKLKGEYIRPIALLQAQPKGGITVEDLKEFLIKEKKIDPSEIAIKISGHNELENIDLFSKTCKIKYIITINALAEGWDCSFAYVLISVANLGSKIAVEQIIGRVIRMPYAKKKSVEAFNQSYVFASAKNFQEAADQVIAGLKTNGYSAADVVNASKQPDEDPYESKRRFSENLVVPLMALGKEKLTFEGLIGAEFELAKQNTKFGLAIHHDQDRRGVIDIKEDGEWTREAQTTLKLTYRDKNFTKDELVQWLDKKLRYPLLLKADKVTFIDKVIDHQLHTYSLTELAINRFVLSARLGEKIDQLLEEYSKEKFGKQLKTKKIFLKAFDPFPKAMPLRNPASQGYNKSYYEQIDPLNGEETAFIERMDLDTLPNIKYWIRNPEKGGYFYIQGWRSGKFYPDFVAVTKKGNILALEWKGEDRMSNDDTKYKEQIAREWEKLGKGKLHFFLVHNGNVDEELIKIKAL